jgi:hypothetical protein
MPYGSSVKAFRQRLSNGDRFVPDSHISACAGPLLACLTSRWARKSVRFADQVRCETVDVNLSLVGITNRF